MTAASPWSADRFARALALVEAGLNYREVGARLGVSKSAIAGVMHRRRPRTVKFTPASLEQRLGWDRVTQTGCRWIEGHPGDGDWRWCGAELMPGGPYCAEHQAIALRKEAA